MSGWLSYVARGENTFYDTLGTVWSELKVYGNEFAAGAAFTYKTASNWFFTPQAKIRMIAENEAQVGLAGVILITGDIPVGSASIMCFGGTVGKTISEGLDVSAGFKYYTGGAFGDLIDLTGYQLSLGLLAEF
jgi:hypothetical protein